MILDSRGPLCAKNGVAPGPGHVGFTHASRHPADGLVCPPSAKNGHRGLFDQLVGTREQRERHCDPQCLSGFKVDH